MEITVQQSKSFLPSNAITTVSISSNRLETVEIAVPFDIDQIDLGYPRLYGTIKMVNNTWSANFVIDFLLLEDNDGEYIFEAETKKFQRTQFRTKESMIQRLEQVYSDYYDLVVGCKLDDSNNVIRHLSECFDNTLGSLKIADTGYYIALYEH